MTTATATQPKHPLVNGRPIRFRVAQQAAWGVLLGTLIFGLFASGLYFGGSQVHWYIHIGPLYWAGFWLKEGWDSGMGIVTAHSPLINLANWHWYRHNYRNIGLPALATMGALSIAGGARKPAGRLYTAVAPLLVLVTAFVLITAGTAAILAQPAVPKLLHAAEAALLGVAIGFVLHRIWRPAGTRIQHFLVDRLMDRHYRRGGAGLPYWVRHNVAPPTVREAAQEIYDLDLVSGEAGRLRTEGHTAKSEGLYVLLALGIVLVLGVDFVGFIGHIWVGVLGHTFPYLAP